MANAKRLSFERERETAYVRESGCLVRSQNGRENGEEENKNGHSVPARVDGLGETEGWEFTHCPGSTRERSAGNAIHGSGQRRMVAEGKQDPSLSETVAEIW